jgi:hypothetical protein
MQHGIDGDLVLVDDEVAHQIATSDLLLAKAGDLSSLVVPLVHAAVRIDANDRRVGTVNEQTQIGRKQRHARLSILAVGDILADTHHANDGTCSISPCCRVQQQLHTRPVFGIQRELEVIRLRALKRHLQHLLDRVLKLGGDEVLNERAAHHLVFRELGDCCGLSVPFVDKAIGIDAEDRGVGRVDQHAEVIRHVRQLLLRTRELGDVLADGNDANDVPALIEPACGIQQHLQALPVVAEERKGEVLRRGARQGLLEHLGDRLAILGINVRVDEVLPHHLVVRKPGQLRGLPIPLVDAALAVDTEDRSVCVLDDLLKVVGYLAQLALRFGHGSDILEGGGKHNREDMDAGCQAIA